MAGALGDGRTLCVRLGMSRGDPSRHSPEPVAEFPVLLGDVGGTNARFAILLGAGEPPVVLPKLRTADFGDPSTAIRSLVEGGAAPRPRSAFLAVAAPVESTVVALTNARWTVDAARIAEDLGLSRVALVNDYVPVAAALAGFAGARGDLVPLGREVPAAPGPRLALGPGTGFGAAALVPVGDRWAVVSTEAGHAEFGPSNEAEAALWPAIERVGGRVTAETLLSGPGLLRLYRALCTTRGLPARLAAPSEVTQAATAGADEVAVTTLALFARLLGRFAGDLALIFGATGGVYLSSGIAPEIRDVLAREGFRTAFESKAPHEDWMRRIATFVVTDPDPALIGLALIASEPGRFVFASRRWMREPEGGSRT